MVPGIVTQGAPLKDSIAVPVGGYVVIRFKADNPGELCNRKEHFRQSQHTGLRSFPDLKQNKRNAGHSVPKPGYQYNALDGMCMS